MTTRSQRESFWLGFLIAGLGSMALVLIAARLPLFSPEEDPVIAAAPAVTSTAAPTAGQGNQDQGQGQDQGQAQGQGQGQGNQGQGQGQGQGGPGSHTEDPFAFGTPSQEVLDAFTAGGCVACHMIKGVGGEDTTIGPPLMLTGDRAATRRPGPTPEAYIEESILNPNAFIMPNCPTGPCPSGIMPQTYDETLSSDQIATLVDFLAALGTARESTVLTGP